MSSDMSWNPQKRYEEAYKDDTEYPQPKYPNVVPDNKNMIIELPVSGRRYIVTEKGQRIRIDQDKVDTDVNLG